MKSNLCSFILTVLAVVILSLVAMIATIQLVHAADTVSTSQYLDLDGNGTVDRIRWTMDENVTACAYEAGDWTVNTAGTITAVITGLSCTGSDAILDILISTDANETGGATDPVISYSNQGTAGSVTLTSGAMTNKASVTATDGAGPVALSAVYLDTDTDGVVDRVDVTMSADVGLACTFEAGDWTFPAAGTVNITAATACAISGNDIRLTVAGDANTTGGAVNPTATYTDQGVANQVQDGAGNDVVISAQAATDSAAPLVVTAVPANNATEVAGNTNIVVNFTEPMTTAGFTVTVTPTVGTLNSVWTNGNATLTVGHPIDFSSNTSYNAVIAGTDASASTIALILGIQPIDWNFTSFTQSSSNRSIQIIQDQQDSTTEPPADSVDEATDLNEDMAANPYEIQPQSPQIAFGKSLAGEDVVLGALIKLADSDTTYYVDENGIRHVFVNINVYNSWYGNDFSDVIVVSADTMASLPLGSPVTYRPGTMIKVESDPRVYLVVGNGIIRHITSESIAEALFGATWNKQIYDVPVSLLFSYTTGDQITTPGQVNLNELESQDITINTEIIGSSV